MLGILGAERQPGKCSVGGRHERQTSCSTAHPTDVGKTGLHSKGRDVQWKLHIRVDVLRVSCNASGAMGALRSLCSDDGRLKSPSALETRIPCC